MEFVQRDAARMISSRNGGNAEEQLKRLDFSSIRFPSDDLKISTLRRRHPDLFDYGFDPGEDAQPQFFLSSEDGGEAAAVIGNMMYCERVLAANSFAAAKGIEGPDCDILDVRDELAELYRQYGIARGEHHAAQLIRDIEAQGATLGSQKHL